MKCDGCPCPEKCLQWPMFCEWVKNGETERFAHICLRSQVKTEETPPVYPSHLEMAGNALAAAGRFVTAWWKGEETSVDTAEAERRLSICFECPEFDRGQARCPLCGCFAKFKTKLAQEHCPLPPEKGGPKW